MKRSAVATVIVVALAVTALAGGSAATAGCDDNRCAPSTAPGTLYGACPSANLWESITVDGDWHDFSHRRTTRFSIPGRRAVSYHVYVSPEPHPQGKLLDGGAATPSSIFTTGAGNIATVVVFPDNPAAPGSVFDVTNETCANYFMRVVADLEALDGPPPARGACVADPAPPPAATDAGLDATADAVAGDATGD